MKFKQFFYKYWKKTKGIWKTGKVQRSSRITYDVFWNVILFFLVVGFIGAFFAGGMGAGYFASLVKDEPIRSYEVMAQDIYNYEETSKLYFADKIYFGDVQSEIYREETTLEEISDSLINAVIATEDEYFEKHEGIVPKAIVRAILQEALNADVKTGGSTLTQQLIKNQILTNEVSFERKAKEILLALRLERFFDKDEILAAYLNIVPYGRDASGGNIAGIQTAAQGIFGIDAKDVNLAQAAYLAGLPQSPSAYTPFANNGGLKEEEGLQPGLNRMKTVLNRMYESEYISKEEYDEALNYDLVADFIEGSASPIEKYPVLTFEVQDRAKDKILNYLAEKDGYSKEDLENNEELRNEYNALAERSLRTEGYEIHSSIDKEIYDAFQEVAKNYQHYGPDTVTKLKTEDGEVEITQSVQAASMLIENSTGRIISFFGGRERSGKDHFNYATQAERSNGSTMKALLAYPPAMEKGAVQPGTPIADVKTSWGGYTPGNFDLRFHGLLSARENLVHSYNIPALKTYSKVMNDNPNPVEQYIEKMGITSLGEKEYANRALAIGGTKHGITIEENTNAFTTFANKGKFVDGYMIEKITTNDGEVIFEQKSKPVDVFSPQTSYLTLDMMRDVISRGSGNYLNSQLKYRNVDWAGKTGTSQDTWDVHFVGTNPNVTFGSWLGYQFQDSLQCDSCELYHSHRNIKLWAAFVNAATDIRPDLMAPSNSFERPEGIVSRSYCAISGMLPSELCAQAGLVQTDLFNAKFVPTKTDDSLIRGSFVLVDGKAVVAGPNTPGEFVEGDGLAFNPEFLERMGYDRLNNISELFPLTNREKWEKIGVPGADVGNAVSDDGKAPSVPGSLNKSGSNLTWNKSESTDVVGYRIYRATKAGGNFSRVGSTTSTSYSIGDSDAVYHVKAVDYFGLESAASQEIIVGDISDPEEETPDTDTEKPETNNDNKDNDNSKEDNSKEDNNSTEDPPEDSGGNNGHDDSGNKDNGNGSENEDGKDKDDSGNENGGTDNGGN
ncbi:penicillin-binding protein [Virgibacillus profundi]|uniref:Penicillin-binding protein n=1 Tax=Virgibacillus profundi TaxID=2024555 RepID=A0A2A2IFW9_9BACI|nr:transglycosylase domain-containing protein [Virgibacillus profundi]PAV30134.1 penicillin-binding protein [Virgibacillus profundi]PXY54306.1 penicillin-binding protein [Virgibacillus profundi]